MVFVVV